MPLNMQQTGSRATRRIVLVVLLIASLALATVYAREGSEGPIHSVQNAVMNVTGRVEGTTAFVGSAAESAGEVA